MATLVTVLRWLVRLAGLAALLLGFALWSAGAYGTLQFHIWLGFLVTAALILLAVFGLVARIPPALPVIALLWAVGLPYLGFAQLHLLVGSNHWLIRVIHLLFGLGAMGLADALGGRILRHATR